jgi:hypothetical protein
MAFTAILKKKKKKKEKETFNSYQLGEEFYI